MCFLKAELQANYAHKIFRLHLTLVVVVDLKFYRNDAKQCKYAFKIKDR